MTEPKQCDGCGADHPSYRTRTEVKITGGTVVVCANKILTLESARESCVAKALDKLRPCPGCGEKLPERTWKRAGLCAKCRDNLDRQRALGSPGELVWVGLDEDRILGDYASRGEDLAALCKAAAEGLATSLGRWHRGHQSGFSVPTILPTPKYAHPGGSFHSGMIAVELPADRVLHLQAAVEAMVKFGDAQYRRGVERGHDALGRLASGEVTVRAYEERKR